MRRGLQLALICIFMTSLSQARAHFIWIDLKSAETGGSRAEVYFGESPEPGQPRLLGKISQTKAWVRGADGDELELKVVPASDPKTAALVALCPDRIATSIEAVCDYGVYERGASGVLLQYYAKHLAGDWPRHAAKLAQAERLSLDVVPSLAEGKLRLQVSYKGKPAVASEIVIVDPAGEQLDLKTDSMGTVTTSAAAAGRYAVRAAVIEADRAGQRDGKEYQQTWHYCTLTLDVPRAAPSAAPEIPAAEALKRARDARSIWQEFPGFTADLEIHDAGQPVIGKVSIDADGAVSLDVPKSQAAEWAEQQLQSLVQHRMPDGEVSEGDVKYADEDLAHPLGRKIDLGDPSQQSVYRIKDDAIMEVNRSMGPLRFTISVLEFVRNRENKYLPRSFTMSFFDAESGELKTTLAYWNDWQRVGRFDLPKTILEVGARRGGTGTKQMIFKNCRLMEPK